MSDKNWYSRKIFKSPYTHKSEKDKSLGIIYIYIYIVHI